MSDRMRDGLLLWFASSLSVSEWGPYPWWRMVLATVGAFAGVVLVFFAMVDDT